MFIALRGERADGHQFIQQAWDRGVRVFVIEREFDFPSNKGFWAFKVKDSLSALQQLARAHRRQFKGQILAITGSYGKTIIKEWASTLMAAEFSVYRSPRSYNSQIGVALSLLGLRPEHDIGIIEAGISQKGEMEKLAEMIQPDWGLISNLGSAHDEGFIDRSEKLQEKLKLFRQADNLIYCSDDDFIAEGISKAKFKSDIKIHSWSNNDEKSSYFFKKSDSNLLLESKQGSTELLIPFQEIPFSQENFAHACTAALCLGMDIKKLGNQIPLLSLPDLRLQVSPGANHCQVINDTYNSDLDSLQIALGFASRWSKKNAEADSLCLVLGDLEQSGLSDEELEKTLQGLLEQNQVNRFIGIGKKLQKFNLPSGLNANFYNTTEELLRTWPKFESETVLFKASRHFGLERAAKRLSNSIHKTRLEIDLDAIEHNLKVYRSKISKECKLAVMVKALGYGSGDHQIAQLLEYNHVDYLGVAYIDEGVRLRQAGIGVPIWVMNPQQDPHSRWLMQENQLEPEVFDLAGLHFWSQVDLPLHIKVDSGMHRLGFTMEDIIELGSSPILRQCNIQSIFTHLAATDSSRDDAFSHRQLELFDAAYSHLSKAWLRAHPDAGRPIKHALNSSGIIRFPKNHYNMVRLGIGLYGYDPGSEIQEELQMASRWLTQVAQVKSLKAGASVGYGRATILETDKKIATINIGYADGFRRSLSEGRGEVAIHGKRCPVIGRVCMDMSMVDVSDLNEVKAGDQVEIFGNQISLLEYADSIASIPYEALTNVSGRVARVYSSQS